MSDLTRPDRILIGSQTTASGQVAASTLRGVYAAWVPPGRVLTVNTFSSELAKLVANAMLAQRISSVNAVSALCEELGADVEEVARALGADARLGPRFLHAGVGFGGSCFEKDILNLAYLARCLHLPEVAAYWAGVLDINRYQRERFARAAVRKLNGTLRGKKLAVFGFAFKDRTNDTRNSVAVHVIAELALEMPREIAIFDPGCAPDEVEAEVRRLVADEAVMARITVAAGWRDAVDGASAALILTQWEQFRGTQHAMAAKDKDSVVVPGGGGGGGGGGGDGDNNNNNNNIGLPSLPLSADKEPSEMDISGIERVISGTGGGGRNNNDNKNDDDEDDDPLHRLLPLPPCEPGCKQCARNSTLSGNKDVVDWETVAALMEDHSWVFDGRNVVDGRYLKSLGFKVHSIGKML